MEVLQLFSSGRNGLAGDLCVYLNYFGAVTSPKHTDKVGPESTCGRRTLLHCHFTGENRWHSWQKLILSTSYQPCTNRHPPGAPGTRRGHDDVLVKSVT